MRHLLRPRSSASRVPFALVACATILCACDTLTSAPPSATVVAPHSGDAQSGTPGYPLPESLAVRVTDGAQQPVRGVVVRWETQQSDAKLSPDSSVTDENGIARTKYTLGSDEGPQTLTARAGNLTAARFAATGRSAEMISIAGTRDEMCGITSVGAIQCWLPASAGGSGSSGVIASATRFDVIDHAGTEWCVSSATGQLACFTAADLRRSGTFMPSAVTPRIVTSFAPRFTQLSGDTVDGVPVHCGLTDGAEAWCWGSNALGHFGNGARGGTRDVPGKVTSTTPFVAVDVGPSAACGLTAVGTLYCWGSNRDGSLARPTSFTESLLPIAVADTLRIGAFAMSGDGAVCGLLFNTGIAMCWGNPAFGALGRRSGASDVPAQVESFAGYFTIRKMTHGFVVLDLLQRMVSWGRAGGVTNVTPQVLQPRQRFSQLIGVVDDGGCGKTLVLTSRCVDVGRATTDAAQVNALPSIFGIPLPPAAATNAQVR